MMYDTISMDNLIKLYHRFEDAESREIFINRLAGVVSGKGCFMDTVIRKYVPEFAECGFYDKDAFDKSVSEIVEKAAGGPVVLYGAGYQGKELLASLEGTDVKAFCDQKAIRGEYEFYGLPVKDPKCLLDEYVDCRIVVTPSDLSQSQEIEQNLKRMGVDESRVIIRDYFNLIRYAAEKQYFDDVVQFGEHEVLIDAGSYDFGVAEEFIKRCNNSYDKIYSLEPDPDNFKETVLRAKKYENVECLNCGLWDKTETLHFDSGLSGASHITEEEGDISIQARSLDEILNGAPATFIKMDIEGAELKALEGARHTIETFKPKLAICIYHKPADVFTIPQIILEMRDDYKLYIRHYSNHFGETVLYAI